MAKMPCEYEEDYTYTTIKPTYFENNVTLYKRGKVVTANFNNNLRDCPAGDLGTILPVGGIPEGYRPLARAVVCAGNVPGNALAMLDIYPDGHMEGTNYGSAISGRNMYRVDALTYIAK